MMKIIDSNFSTGLVDIEKTEDVAFCHSHSRPEDNILTYQRVPL